MNRISIVFVGAVALATSILAVDVGSSAMRVLLLALGVWLFVGAIVLRQRAPASSRRTVATPYAPVLDIDASIFDDPIATEARGLEVFRAWARKIAGSPLGVEKLARSVLVAHHSVGRVTTTIETRRFVWRERPWRSTGTANARLDVDHLDPWSPPADLQQQTRSITLCPKCSGVGQVKCACCAGTGNVRCGACDGAGKCYQTASNGSRRLMNCTACAKSGKTPCFRCSLGTVRCAPCEGAGRFERWAEVDVSSREQGVMVSANEAAFPFSWATDPSASRAEMKSDATLLDDVRRARALTAGDVGGIGGEATMALWQSRQERLGATARITHQHLEQLHVPTVSITYGFGDEERSVELLGLRLLAPAARSADLFAQRALSTRLGIAATACGWCALVFSFLARGPFFATTTVHATWAVAFVAGIFGLGWLYRATMFAPRSTRWMIASLTTWVLAFVGVVQVSPQLDHVQTLLAANDFDAARVELLALDGENSDRYRPEWAVLQLQDVRNATTAVDTERKTALIDAALPQHEVAAALVDDRFIAEAETNLVAGDASAARAALQHVSAKATHRTGDLVVAVETKLAQQCGDGADWRCAFQHAAAVKALDVVAGERLSSSFKVELKQVAAKAMGRARSHTVLVERGSEVAGAIDLLQVLRAEDPAAEPRLQEALKLQAETTRGLLRQQEIERKQQAAIEARRQAQQDRDARREAERQRQRDWFNSPLQCCDGSLSPSCTRGGNHRGCCSRHGGVCGR